MNPTARHQAPKPQPLSTADVLRFMVAAFITGVSVTMAFYPSIEQFTTR